MRVSAATPRQELLATIAERVDQRSTGITPLAANPEVLGLQGRALFKELQRAWAIGGTAVDEVVPREVVQVPAAASNEKARGYSCWR